MRAHVDNSLMFMDTLAEDLPFDRAIETYNLMSERFLTHASPTLFNAGTPHPN